MVLIFSILVVTGSAFAGNLRVDTVIVEIKGTVTDARFVPAVVKVQPGDVIQFEVREGLHTVTAYHPENRRPLRIPKAATPFDSGLLKPGEIWFLSIDAEGVYDYFCLPHERMGHVGRIFSGSVEGIPAYPADQIPDKALKKIDSLTIGFNKTILINPKRK
ncbi:MAG: plastocyanin/azurin family copper-binding protein [Balneolaceae bacterium]|nr:plastocyanin/azurin family copper-binding protein [Balneolaceae bacterium]